MNISREVIPFRWGLVQGVSFKCQVEMLLCAASGLVVPIDCCGTGRQEGLGRQPAWVWDLDLRLRVWVGGVECRLPTGTCGARRKRKGRQLSVHPVLGKKLGAYPRAGTIPSHPPSITGEVQ